MLAWVWAPDETLMILDGTPALSWGNNRLVR